MNKIDIIKSVFLSHEENGINLTSYLAKQGNSSAVQKLIILGAKEEDAAYGYAIASNQEKITQLLKACQIEKQSAIIAKIIKGYARSGCLDKIYELEDYQQYKKDLLVGLAQNENYPEVTSLLDRDISLFPEAVEGYASTNRAKLLTQLIKGTKLYPHAIYYAARSGHTELVKDLLMQCGIKPDYSYTPQSSSSAIEIQEINAYSMLNIALKGYITGRHFYDAIGLLARGANISQAVLDLKIETGLPSFELYFAFLNYIKDPTLRTTVQKNMAIHAEVMESLQISKNDIKEIEQIIECMVKLNLNYIEARLFIEGTNKTPTKGEISLSYLAEIITCQPDETSQSSPAPK